VKSQLKEEYVTENTGQDGCRGRHATPVDIIVKTEFECKNKTKPQSNPEYVSFVNG